MRIHRGNARLEQQWWMVHGACRAYAPELWFPDELPFGRIRETAREIALMVCAQCPVLAQCRQYASDEHMEFGIWGGIERRSRKQ